MGRAASDGRGDRRAILAGTGQNIAGLAIFVVATLGTNVLISRAFGASGASVLGAVTLARTWTSETWTLKDQTPIPWRLTTRTRLVPFLSSTRTRSESGAYARPARSS